MSIKSSEALSGPEPCNKLPHVLCMWVCVFQALEALLGEELAEFLGSGERRMRLLRELRTDTRAKGMWARFVNDQNGSRRHKSGTKKGGSTTRSGCFGHKMDRIGTISGMGCQPAYYPSTNNLSWYVGVLNPLCLE